MKIAFTIAITVLSLNAMATNAVTVGYATVFTLQSCLAEGNTGITKSGKLLNDSMLWCATTNRLSRSQWGKVKYRVTNLKTKQSIVVTQMDLGPSKHCVTEHSVVIDLTAEAMRQITINDSNHYGRVQVSIIKL